MCYNTEIQTFLQTKYGLNLIIRRARSVSDGHVVGSDWVVYFQIWDKKKFSPSSCQTFIRSGRVGFSWTSRVRRI